MQSRKSGQQWDWKSPIKSLRETQRALSWLEMTSVQTVVSWADIRDVLYANVILGYALIIASILQARIERLGLTVYHATVILNLNWVITFCSIPCFLYALKQHTVKHTLWKLCFLIGHLTFNGAFGLWFFITIDHFDTMEPNCTQSTLIDVLGKHVAFSNLTFRHVGIALYSILSFPLINYLFVSFVFSAIVAAAGIFILPFLAFHTAACRYFRILRKLALPVVFVTTLLMYMSPVILMLTLTERTMAINNVGPGERDFTFGQTVALLVALPPIWKVLVMANNTLSAVVVQYDPVSPLAFLSG
jgi:hypothetical protein